MSFKVNITDTAAADLYQIYDYIEKVLLAPQAAENLYNDIIEMIKSLSEMPERYREYDSERFAGKNLRFVNVKNYDILYTVNNKAKIK
jgi:toxin ParE1/3/4